VNKEDFKKPLPHLEEWTAVTSQDIQFALMRSSGFLEASEGIKTNPEIASRMNLNELKLLQVMVRLVFTIQCRGLDQEKKIEDLKALQNQVNELRLMLSIATEENSTLRETISNKKKRNKKPVSEE